MRAEDKSLRCAVYLHQTELVAAFCAPASTLTHRKQQHLQRLGSLSFGKSAERLLEISDCYCLWPSDWPAFLPGEGYIISCRYGALFLCVFIWPEIFQDENGNMGVV